MPTTDFETIIKRSIAIRQKYHELELKHHGSEWTVEEDALAFLTDAGLVGRHTMSQQKRWPKANTETELKHKIGESMWWLIALSNRMDIDAAEAMEDFLKKTEDLF